MYRLNALAQNKTEWKTNLNYRENVMKDLSSNKSLINTWRKLYYFNSLKLGLNLIHDKRTSHLSPSLSSQCSAILKMSAIFDKPENILSIYSVKARHTNTRIRQSWLYFTNLIARRHDTRIFFPTKKAYIGQWSERRIRVFISAMIARH